MQRDEIQASPFLITLQDCLEPLVGVNLQVSCDVILAVRKPLTLINYALNECVMAGIEILPRPTINLLLGGTLRQPHHPR